MADNNTSLLGLLIPIFLALLVIMMTTVMQYVRSDSLNQVKIECFLHRDNADVHKLCVDHGYDR